MEAPLFFYFNTRVAFLASLRAFILGPPSVPSMSLHEIPNDSRDVDLGLGVGVHVGPTVLKVPDARDKLVALPTAGPHLARETIPLLCAVHLRGIVFVNGAAHVIIILLHNVRLLSRG